MTGGECWGGVVNPVLFALGAGVGILMGALAAVACWLLGYTRWSPLTGFPKPDQGLELERRDCEALWDEIERRH